MYLQNLLREQIERERTHLEGLKVGSEEYEKSFARLIELEDRLADLEKHLEGKKDRTVKNVIEGVKVAGGIALPLVGYVAVTAFEKNETFTSALKGVVNCFIPKKM